ncbi:MAG: DUF935 domain-containing protein, partial [Bacteroidia bacterium]|nr:DUF935 domain-containing protein [Bacteroidia bacterium]
NTSLYYLPIGKAKDLGYLHKIAPAALAKKFALGIWGEYNEKIGIPFRSVTTNYNDDDRRRQLGVIMENMGSAGWAVLNEGEKVELLQVAAGDPYKCFQELIKVLDSQMSKFVLGQDSTADGASKTGTYGSMEVLQEISEDRHESDLINACNIINNVLFPKLRLLGYKLSDTDVFEWDKSLELGVAEYVDYVEKLAPFYDIDTEEVSKKIGIKLTAKKTEAAPGGAVPKK